MLWFVIVIFNEIKKLIHQLTDHAASEFICLYYVHVPTLLYNAYNSYWLHVPDNFRLWLTHEPDMLVRS